MCGCALVILKRCSEVEYSNLKSMFCIYSFWAVTKFTMHTRSKMRSSFSFYILYILWCVYVENFVYMDLQYFVLKYGKLEMRLL